MEELNDDIMKHPDGCEHCKDKKKEVKDDDSKQEGQKTERKDKRD